MCNLFFVLYCLFYFSYFIEISESFILKQNIINRNQPLNALCYRKLSVRHIPRRPSTFRAAKAKLLDEFRENFSRTKAIFQFRSVAMVHPLRKHIIDNINKNIPEFNKDNPPYRLKRVKNSFMKVAVTGTPFEILIPNMQNTNYYLFIFDDSIVPKLMSVINGIKKASPITVKCFEPSFACYADLIYPGNHMRNLSSLPPKEELCKRITPIFKQPFYKMLNSVSFPLRVLSPINQVFCNLLSTLKQIKPNESTDINNTNNSKGSNESDNSINSDNTSNST